MASEKEYTGRTRSLRILLAIIESPFFYTRDAQEDVRNDATIREYGRAEVTLD